MNGQQKPPIAIVVNDDPIQLSMLAGMLNRAGIEAGTFEGPEAALAAMNPDTPPDLIVTDLYMPGLDGWRFCRLLRSPEYAAFNEVPILVVSATFAGDEPESIVVDIGADAFLPAPVDGKEFITMTRALLLGREVRRRPRVLIVEDGKALAGMLKKAFDAHGYRADKALTFRQAQAAFSRTNYDLAVLDYHLPDGTGEALLEDFLKQRPDCVCLMMTTDPTPQLALNWMKKGASAYLRKPFEAEFLIELCVRARRERALLRAEDLLEARTRELRENEDNFRLIAENTSDLISLMDMNLKFTYVSPSITQLTGFTVEEALNYSIEDIIPLHSVKQIRKLIEKELQEEASGSVDLSRNRIIEYKQYKKDKSAIWVESNCRFLRDADQKPRGIIIISRNISKRKQAEDALKASEANFRAFFDSMQDMIVVGTPEGRILYANDAIIDKLGYSLKELVAIGILGVHPPDRRLEAEEIFAAMFRGEQKTCLLPLQRKDGELIPVETRVFFGKWDGQECIFGICKDISAEQEAQQKFERLFQKNPALMALSSLPDRRFVDVNDAFLETLGFDRAEVLGRTAAELALFPDADQQKTLSEQLALKGSISAYELLVRAKDGSFCNGIFSGEVVSSQDRKYFLTVMIDITERKKAEIALQKNEDRLNRILLSSNDGWWDWDLARDSIYYSDRWWEMLGYTKNELPSDSSLWRRLMHPDDAERVQRFFDSVLASDSDRYEIEFRMCHKQGHSIPVISKGYLFRDSLGTVKKVSGINIDLSERKDMEEQLRLHSLVLSQIEDRVTITDLNGNITFINDAEVRTLGFSRDELIGASTEQYGDNSEKGATQQEILAETLKNGKWRGEVINQTKDGREVILDCRTQVVFDEHGHKVALAGIATDITERKRAEAEKDKLQAQLIQAQKLESVGRLAGGIAHDFNNMLGVILGRAEMALESVEENNQLHVDLQEIQKAARHSADLTRQLLAFARKQAIAPKPIELNETVAGMLKMLQRLIGEDIELIWKPCNNNLPVKMDPAQIDQVLANLCVNARDAISNNGRVSIETDQALFDEEFCDRHSDLVPGEYVLLAVSDNGCGMDQQTLANIFEPFFTTKEVGQGTGLGLATVFGAVKQNHGFINVYSEPGQGTTFKIYLPRLNEPELQETEKQKAQELERGNETILLVEDEPAILSMSIMILERLGYIVLAARTPDDALRLAVEHASCIDLLMTDVIMPGMNGRDLARNLLAIHPEIKCLFMSGYTSDVIAQHGVLDHGVHFIQKPFSMKDLSEKIRQTLT